MARKKKDIRQQLSEVMDVILSAIRGKYSLGCILIDRKNGEICYMQDNKLPAMMHIGALIESCLASDSIDSMLKHVHKEALEDLRDYLDECLDEEEEHTCFACSTCRCFQNKGFNFGTCRYEDKDFDGERIKEECENYKPQRK